MEVQNYITSLNIRKTSGLYEITTKITNVSSALLTPIFTKLFNLSIENGLFPKALQKQK